MSLQEGVGLEIEHAEYKERYSIAMAFSDGHCTVVDFEPFLSSSSSTETRQFLDVARFREFRLEWGNIVWGDYELCFPLEDLYVRAQQRVNPAPSTKHQAPSTKNQEPRTKNEERRTKHQRLSCL
jgi:hypothetical protein